MRVLIADDSAFMRRMLTKMFEADPAVEVVGTARNGADAVAKCAELKPDIVTMDVEMPVMDGLSALREIRRVHGSGPPGVLMCSTLTDEGSKTALEALRLGAADVIAKEQIGQGPEAEAFKRHLRAKLRAIAAHLRSPHVSPATPAARAASPLTRDLPDLSPARVDAVVIGSSTGGPPVLETIVRGLTGRPVRPVLIAQHMPALFTRSLAARLDELTPADVRLAEDGMPLEGGAVYLAEGGTHLRMARSAGRLRAVVSTEPADALYKPSVNELFGSAATATGSRTLGVMLTGMGDDGSEGARRLRDRGGTIVAQTPESCVVYGMPRAVTEAGIASASVSPDQAATLIAVASGAADGTTGTGGSMRRSA